MADLFRFRTAPPRNAGGTVGAAPGVAPTGYDPAYGGIPGVPNLIDIYGHAAGANQRFLPQLTSIGADVTAGQQAQALNNLRMALGPEYDTSVANSMKNILAKQQGYLAPGTTNKIAQTMAERGIRTGFYDSPAANAALVAAMGKTAEEQQMEGEREMTALVGRTPQVKPWDISSLMINPMDLYNSNMMASLYRSAPVPKAAANQMISDSIGGYNLTRGGNVPTYGGVSLPGGAPYVPITRDVIGSPLSATGPFTEYKPAKLGESPSFNVSGRNLYGTGPITTGRQPVYDYDKATGGFINRDTGEITYQRPNTPMIAGLTEAQYDNPTFSGLMNDEEWNDFSDIGWNPFEGEAAPAVADWNDWSDIGWG